MIDCILSRIESVHENLRTNEVQGLTDTLPEIGKPFKLVGESLTPGRTGRLIYTTPVKEVRLHPEEGSLEFWTENSHYGLQVLDMDTQGEVH